MKRQDDRWLLEAELQDERDRRQYADEQNHRELEMPEGGGDEHAHDCPVCCGNPISDKPCICGGTGSIQWAYTNLLKQHYDLERALAAERERWGKLREIVEARLRGCPKDETAKGIKREMDRLDREGG